MTKASFAVAVDPETGHNFQRFNFTSDKWEIYTDRGFQSESAVTDLSNTYQVSANAKPSTAPVMSQVALRTDEDVAARRAAKAAAPKHHWWDGIIQHLRHH